MLYQTENRHGGDIYGGIALDFSANVSPLGTPRSVTDAIERALPELYRYPDPYCRTLVQTISEYEGVPKNFVLCGNGASELIYAYCGAVRPKRAMELAPTFSEYSLALRRTGCEIVRHTLAAEQNFDLQEDLLPRLSRARNGKKSFRKSKFSFWSRAKRTTSQPVRRKASEYSENVGASSIARLGRTASQ